MKNRTSFRASLILSCAIAVAALFVDLNLGGGVASGVLYILSIVILAFGANRGPILAMAVACSLLTGIGFLFSQSGDETWIALTNRGLALFAIWATAILALIYKRQETKSIEAEHRYQAVFHQTFDLMAVLRPSGAIEEINETMRASGPAQVGRLEETTIWDAMPWDAEGRERLRHGVTAAASGDFFRDEFRIHRPNGDDMVVDLSLKPVRNPAGEVDLVILEARDVTEHKRDQELLIRGQKMEILGQFASGIAHDFNNLLTVIAGNLELAERRIKDDDAITDRIGKAVQAVFKGRALTDRILTFARKQELEPRPVQVKALIAEAVDLSRSGLDENTSIESEIAPDLWPCWADPAQLQTALFNLLINARDAMPNGGRVTIRGSNYTKRSQGQAEPTNLPNGDFVLLSVSDQGEGIPRKILPKITEPFFTTKEPGSGSGLGLSMVADFIEQSGGDLKIDSAEGRGATVSLYLPRARQAVVTTPHWNESAGSGGDGHILVVEDDPDVRETAVSMLSDLGYRVEEAADGEEALQLLREDRGFDLLLTDLKMPGDKDGRELARLSRAISPNLAVLYSSGNPEMAAEVRSEKGGPHEFIGKPYHYAELAQKAEGLLARVQEKRRMPS